MDQSRSPRRMSSRSRRRLALGGLAAASASLAGCNTSDADLQPAEFTSVSACVSAGFPQDLCSQGYDAAAKERQANAPRFATREKCEEDWGENHCSEVPADGTTASGGHSFFGPMLTGFILSQALQRRYYNRDDRGGTSSAFRGSPIYRDRAGSTVTLDRSSGRAVTTPVNVNTRTVSSRGFGGMGMSRGGGFGG